MVTQSPAFGQRVACGSTVTARGSFDPVVFGWYGFLASIRQAEGSEPEFAQGATGYGKRYGLLR